MLDWLLGRVHDTKHGAPALRVYLWWGLVIRAALLVALVAVLAVEGNVLAAWLLRARIPFVAKGDIEELTAISYGVIFGLLVVGAGTRWMILRRLDTTNNSEAPTKTPAAEGDSTAGE